jgi:hypothetical protein
VVVFWSQLATVNLAAVHCASKAVHRTMKVATYSLRAVPEVFRALS